ncbi:peptidoglycan/LPS O-acetylase OafA/YrhL [Rhizobium sp. OAE497]
MKYRAEIDGLRAIAVVPVILYHAGMANIRGGFAGVDVFFVISGFLITSIIMDEVSKGSFTFLSFYERRARRIAPALLVVCAACLPFAWLWMLPKELNDFGKSLYHVCLSISNFLFWQETRYFGGAGDLKPLLHTWSLAVEEQFYLLFPVLLVLSRGAWSKALRWVVFLSVVSFLLTQIIPRFSASMNFYLLPSRFWELGAGAAVALVVNDGRAIQHRYAGVIATLGLIAICFSYFMVSETAIYPGLQTLPVVCGTVAVIAFASQRNFAGRLLGSPPLVVIGLGSYSLYLWHQPIFAFARIRSFGNLSSWDYAGLIGLCGALAFVTYRYVEQPFRRRSFLSRRTAFAAFGAVGTAFISVGLIADKTEGLESHFEQITQANAESFGLDHDCNGRILAKCQTAEAPDIAVWGDSYAMHLVDGIMASNPQAKLVQFNMSNCGPFIDLTPVPANAATTWPETCLDHNDKVFQYFKRHPSVKTVVVSSPFYPYIRRDHVFLRGSGLVQPSLGLAVSEFKKTLDLLSSMGIKPVVFAPPPQDGVSNMGLCIARARKWGIPNNACSLSAAKSADFNRDTVAFLKQVSATYIRYWISRIIYAGIGLPAPLRRTVHRSIKIQGTSLALDQPILERSSISTMQLKELLELIAAGLRSMVSEGSKAFARLPRRAPVRKCGAS